MRFDIAQFDEFEVHIHQFENVRNAAEIKKKLISGAAETHDFAFINGKVVTSIEQILAAVYRALLDYTTDKIRTKTLHSEVLFSLSPTQNIMDALKKFGLQDDSTELFIVKVIHRPSQPPHYSLGIIDGDEVEALAPFPDCDLKLIKKLYKLPATAEDPEVMTRHIINAIQLRGL